VDAIAHATENLLSELRAGQCTLDEEISSVLFAAIDFIRKQAASIEQNQCEGDCSIEEIVNRLNNLQKSKVEQAQISVFVESVVKMPIATKLNSIPV